MIPIRKGKTMIRAITAAVALALAALATAAGGFGGSNPATTVRASVGPGFTIKLTKNGRSVKSLRAGMYRFVVSDRSPEHNFVLQHGSSVKQLTTVAFVGTRTVTVKLSNGAWTFFCAPHESAMSGQFRVGGREAEPGDDQGGGREPEPGDDRGGHH
jgi:plastocyanin